MYLNNETKLIAEILNVKIAVINVMICFDFEYLSRMPSEICMLINSSLKWVY